MFSPPLDSESLSKPLARTGPSSSPRGQRAALLLTLEGWSLDLDGYEAIPQDLLRLRDALIADLHEAEPRD